MLSRKIDALVVLALCVMGAVAACSSDGADAPGTLDPEAGVQDEAGDLDARGTTDAEDGSLAADGDLDASDAADAADAADAEDPDLPIVAFPLTIPKLFGYALVDAFPGMFLSGAMDMEWPAGSSQPFVLQRGGHIVRLQSGTTRTVVLDFSAVVALRDEAGALGMALHPGFSDAVGAPNPYVYVWYTMEGAPTHQRLSRFTWIPNANPTLAVFNRASELIMVDQIEQVTQHNGARIRFGPDGFLYFGNGDDTRSGATAQTLTAGLFSGVFRIDVDQAGGGVSHAPPRQPTLATTQGYFIPNSNPFVGTLNANEEYFALGFRNPYSMNFDRMNGALWLGDVGDNWREEVDLITSGGNYNWPYFEGKIPGPTVGASTIGAAHQPIFDNPHYAIGDLSAIMGGYVYRGAALTALSGKFVFSDWPTGRLWALDTAAGTRTSLVEANFLNAPSDVPVQPVGFGQDNAGEIYMITWSKILKLVADPAPALPPAKLSDTHIFRNLATLRPATSLMPFSIRSPLWSDGLSKQRWVHVPASTTASMAADGTATLPQGSILVKQFDLPSGDNPVGRTRRLETRIMVTGSVTTYGLSYRWNAAGTDADLVTNSIDDAITDVVPSQSRTWHFPSFGECWSCHRPEDRVLGFRGEQLNFVVGGTNQLTTLAAQGVFDASIALAPAPLVSPSDGTATIDARASAYLAANCSSCHRPGNSFLGAGQTWNALPNVLPANRGLIGMPHHNFPVANGLGLPAAPLIASGNPNGSLLLARIRTTNRDLGMPPVGRTMVDPVGDAVITAWITSGP